MIRLCIISLPGIIIDLAARASYQSPSAFWKVKAQVKAEKKEAALRSTLTLTATYSRCGLAWDKARPWAKRLSWQTQGGRVKYPPGLAG